MDPEASFFGDFGELCANSCVEEGDPTSDFAAERVEKGVVTGTGSAPERFVVTFRRKFNGVTKPDCATNLKLPVIKMKPVLLGG